MFIQGRSMILFFYLIFLDYFAPFWNMTWDYSHLKKYEEELAKITAHGGTIFLNYIFNYGIGEGFLKSTLIGCSKVTTSDITDEEVHKLPPRHGVNVFDGVILKRVR